MNIQNGITNIVNIALAILLLLAFFYKDSNPTLFYWALLIVLLYSLLKGVIISRKNDKE